MIGFVGFEHKWLGNGMALSCGYGLLQALQTWQDFCRVLAAMFE
jgi:hypothetical protein